MNSGTLNKSVPMTAGTRSSNGVEFETHKGDYWAECEKLFALDKDEDHRFGSESMAHIENERRGCTMSRCWA